MAPSTRGTKRPAPTPAEGAMDKKLFEWLKTQGVSRPTYKAIVEALEHPHLVVSNECRRMLTSMVAKSLCVPSDERHAVQGKCVDMIGDAIAQVQATMQAAIDAEQAAVAKAESSASDMEGKLQESKEALTKEQEKHDAAKKVLTDASESVLSAKAALGVKHDEQKTADAGFVQIKADKDSFDQVIEHDLIKLRDGTWEEGEAKKHFDALAALFGKFTLEDSLQAVLPGSLMKKPAERGSFDVMAVTQLEESMQAKVKELNASLDQQGPQVRERQAAVDSAQKGFDDASAAQKDAAGALSVAQESDKTAVAAVSAVTSLLASGQEEVKKVSAVRDEKTNELEVFQYTLGLFEQLKTKMSAKTAPTTTEEQQEAQPAVAGA